MARRVVITGVGILSSLGNSFEAVVESLRSGRSGIVYYPLWEELSLSSFVGGKIHAIEDLKAASGIPQVKLACMSEVALYCVLAAKDAIEDAGLVSEELQQSHTACLVGSGVSCVQTIYAGGNLIYSGRAKRISPYSVVRSMTSSCSASITNVFPVRGRSYSIGSACTTSTHNIGHAYELIRTGKLLRAIAGGGEAIDELITGAFSALRIALSTHYNDTPERASRPYDKDRNGFVISGGGGIVILEALDSAQARGAEIYGEIIGYAANSDGYNILHPDPEGMGAAECMGQALSDAGIAPWEIDYINTHGTSTTVGDSSEIKAIRRVFGEKIPLISSTKSMGGHPIGAAGVHELIHCIAMLQSGFVAPSINIENMDPEFEDIPIVTEARSETLKVIMSNTFGFGGTNGTLIVKSC